MSDNSDGLCGGMVGFLRESDSGFVPIWFNWLTIADLKTIGAYAKLHNLQPYPVEHFSGSVSLIPPRANGQNSGGSLGKKPEFPCPDCGNTRWAKDKKGRWWYCSGKDQFDNYCGHRVKK